MFTNLSDTLHLLSYAILAFFGLYILFELYLFSVAIRFPVQKKKTSSTSLGVSLLIPIKNEAPRLPRLLDSLEQLHFSGDLEIIFINDDSDDNSTEVITRHVATSSRSIRIINGTYDPSQRLTSKQQAMDLGINQATFDLIALTDADMELKPEWIDELCGALKEDTALVFGHTAIRRDGTIFTAMQSFQLEYLFSIAILFHYAAITGSCMGNNLLLRKKAYLDCGGQNAIGYSITEDRALLRLFHRNNYPTEIVTPFFPTAFTLPHFSLSGFLQQITRWASGGFSNGLNLLFFGSIFTIYNLLFVFTVTGIFSGWCLIAGLCSFLVSWVVTAVVFIKNRSPVSPLLFPMFHLMVIFEIAAITGLLLIGKKQHWKGRGI